MEEQQMEDKNIMTELEQMREQMQMLRDKLDKQEIVNDKLVRRAVKSKDTEDIREAKATFRLFSTKRKLTRKQLAEQKPQTTWGKIKYAAIFAIGILLDLFVDYDDSIED